MTKTAFITGGTGSIGQALVRRFASDGYRVHFQYCRREGEALELERDFGAHAHRIDFAKPWSAPGLEIQVLINNAAVNLSGRPAWEVSEDEVTNSLEINVISAFRFCRSYATDMIKNRWGRI